MKKYLFMILLAGFMIHAMSQDHAAIIASIDSDDKYFTSVMVETDFETTIVNVKAVLKEQEFGIVSEIDMQAKLKKGTGKDVPKYVILGACNPPGAYKALQIEKQIGVMLPCNVIIRDTGKGVIEVAAINPMVSMKSINNPYMEPLAKEISEKLKKALSNL